MNLLTSRNVIIVAATLFAASAIAAVLLLVTMDDGDNVNAQQGEPGFVIGDPDIEIDLTAGVFDWEVYPGEVVEAWGYNQQYPGPEIRVTEGDKVRLTLINDLPEATTIHFHGLDVPNDQDGVPGITQPDVQPGETWTYEFVAERVGTSAYHTHSNTAKQLAKGLFGFFIVEPEGGLDYDREFALGLHEIEGLYTINGYSFPSTLENELLQIKSGERVLVRFANMGAQHHPMHLHGHQFTVVNIDGNSMPPDWKQNTVDIPPGQTVDVVIEGTNPGTWVFHCHIVPHVTNRGEYPGGMLAVLDYEDHTSYFEEQAAAAAEDESSVAEEQPTAAVEPTDIPANALDVILKEFVIEDNDGTQGFSAAPGEVTFDVRNDGAAFHELAIIETDLAPGDLPVTDGLIVDEEAAGELIDRTSLMESAVTETLVVDLSPGSYVLLCNVPGHYTSGMFAKLVVR